MNILFGDDVTKTFEQSQEKIIKIREDEWAKAFRPKEQQVWKCTYWIHRILPNSARFETIERIMAIKLNDPNYHPIVPILPLYKPESVNETQELFDSISITTDITISKSRNKVCEKSSCDNIVEKSVTNLPQLFFIVLAQDQSNITETKIEIPESLIFLSSENLIKNESDIYTLIFYLQEKFQISKEKLKQ
ncbi:25387_t:CDS:2 [Gigaspora rosea]|nr:25387_t:CDS:2 [Gigaspora rosea]